jgi:hypothetical protein
LARGLEPGLEDLRLAPRDPERDGANKRWRGGRPLLGGVIHGLPLLSNLGANRDPHTILSRTVKEGKRQGLLASLGPRADIPWPKGRGFTPDFGKQGFVAHFIPTVKPI